MSLAGLNFDYNPWQYYDERRVLAPSASSEMGSEQWTTLGATWGPSEAMWNDPERAWYAENWSNPNNVTIEEVLPDGSYIIKEKSGDKEGTRYLLAKTDTGYTISEPIDKVTWDTNNSLLEDPMVLAMIAAVGVITAGAAGLFAPLGLPASSAAWAPAAAEGTVGSSILGELTAGSVIPEMAASDALLYAGGEPIAGSGFSTAASGTPSFGSPWTTAATLSQAGEAAGSIGNLANMVDVPGAIAGGALSLGTSMTEAAALSELGLLPPNVPEILPPTTVTGTPPTTPPTTPPGTTPPPPGTTPPGGTTTPPGIDPPPIDPTVTSSLDDPDYGNILDWALRLADMYNKKALGDKQRDLFTGWADKGFGKSAEFENMLMNTYTDPRAWLFGPEGQALREVVDNQSLRTDSRAGNLSNDMRRSDELLRRAMLGQEAHRTGLVNSANIGRNAFGQVVNAAGRAFEGTQNAANWYTPATFGSGQPGSSNVGNTVKDLWGVAKDVGGVVKNIWNWFDDDEA